MTQPRPAACLTLCILALAAACTSAGREDARPLPRSARALCTAGIYGGGSATELRAGGDVRTQTFGANAAAPDSLAGRDSARVAELLARVARLPWDELTTQPGLTDVQCALSATWDDTTRAVAWFPPSPPRALADVVRLSAEIMQLPQSVKAPVPAAPREPEDSLGTRLETGCSGGSTGGGAGVIVTRDGRFLTWKQESHRRETRTLSFVRRDSARAAQFFATAERDGLTRVRYSEPSNMTCFLALEAGAGSSEVAWPMGTPPRKIRPLVRLADELSVAGGREPLSR